MAEIVPSVAARVLTPLILVLDLLSCVCLYSLLMSDGHAMRLFARPNRTLVFARAPLTDLSVKVIQGRPCFLIMYGDLTSLPLRPCTILFPEKVNSVTGCSTCHVGVEDGNPVFFLLYHAPLTRGATVYIELLFLEGGLHVRYRLVRYGVIFHIGFLSIVFRDQLDIILISLRSLLC